MATELGYLDPNWHVKSFLKYYVDLPHSPQYAVLLNGTWGIGKTFLVKKFLKDRFETGYDYAYVSLYGLRTTEEVDSAVIRSIYPVFGFRATKITGTLLKLVAQLAGRDTDINIKELLNKHSSRIYVFDDLERCNMDIGNALGYINEFVEHDECKVIIIANESEIRQSKDYIRRREKVVGKTLEVKSALSEALSFFITKVSSEVAGLFKNNLDELNRIYQQAGLDNLRILQQTLWDFERVYAALGEEHKRNEKAILTLLRLIFALSFELKAGRINAADLRGRAMAVVAGMMNRNNEKPVNALATASSRYPNIQLEDTILTDDLLVDILIRGVIDEKAICASISQSPYFAGESEPAWRAVWHGLDRTDEEFQRAYDTMETEFARRHFTEPGIILHVFGLRLWACTLGMRNSGRAAVVQECKAYVNDLYAQKRLVPLSPDTRRDEFGHGGYGGLGFFEDDSPEFGELCQFLRQERIKAYEDSYPDRARDLLQEMKSDPNLFYRRLNYSNTDETLFHGVPILAWIDVKEFTNALIVLPPSGQRSVRDALKERYSGGRLQQELSSERAWLSNVRLNLETAIEKLPPLSRHRLSSVLAQIERLLHPKPSGPNAA